MTRGKLWGGRFQKSSSEVTEQLSASIDYDKRLYDQDIRGSIAHAKMLAKSGIISNEDSALIERGLEEIRDSIQNGSFSFSSALEDIHMNIESALTEKIGDAGKRLHTARSRNDQVALDMRMYLRDESERIVSRIDDLVNLLADKAESEIDTIMPGYTHMQIAQPVRLSHHLLAHAWALIRDKRRFEFAAESASLSPLGAGALAGVNYKTDRHFVEKELGFSGITQNSMDTTADRDFALDFLYACSVIGMHLSRFCEELVYWSGSEFGYIRLADSVTTGSSIMPQKRNPDLAEIIRGKSGRLFGNLIALLTVMKGLPLTYNRDMQEDKEPIFDSCDTVLLSLDGMIEMLKDIIFNADRMRQSVYGNFSTATDLADYLAARGVPFRTSHEIVGSIVKHCEQNKKNFFELTIADLQSFSEAIGNDVLEAIDPSLSTERKLSEGSTSKKSVLSQIAEIRKMV